MRAFVTEGTGLLGANLIRALVWEGWRVKTLVRSMETARRVLRDASLSYIPGEVSGIDRYAHDLRGCDVLFHAGEPSPADGELFAEALRAGIRTVVRRGSSSDAVQAPGIRVVTIVPAVMIGPNDGELSGTTRMIEDVLAGRRIEEMEDGLSIVDARDVAEAMIRAAEAEAARETYVVGGRYYSGEALRAALERAAGVPVVESRPCLLGRLLRRPHRATVLNSECTVVELGVMFRPLEATLRDAVEWVREQHAHGLSAVA